MRLFLDADVLFSAAAAPSGRALALHRLAGVGRCRLVASNHVLAEARRNLAARAADRLAVFEDLLEHVTLAPEAPPKLVAWAAGKGLPAKDAPVLAAAVVAGADLLVTGDRSHLGHLFGEDVGGVAVVPMAAALGRVLQADGH